MKAWPTLEPKEAEELVAASPVEAERVQGTLHSAPARGSSGAPLAKRSRNWGRTCF